MSKKIFKRKIYQQMLNWKTNSAGKSALLIEGARRVGKSTLAQHFAEQEYDSYLLIDFANLNPEVQELIDTSLTDLNYLFMRLQLFYKVTLKERKSAIIFDEVQLQPKVRQAVKYLVKDGRYDYIETNNLQQVDMMKRRILNLYADDLHKLDSTDKLRALFLAIPSELSKNTSRFQATTVIENVKQYQMQELLEMLHESMIVNIAYNSSDPNVGLAMTANKSRYKLFLADTGLFVTLAFWDKSFTENIIYQKLWADKLNTNLGYLYENVVAQMLRAAGYELYYHTFPTGDNHNYEVDFLLSKGQKIVPIEVKSSGYKTHKSLDAFCEKYPQRVGERILLYTKDYQKDGPTSCLPVYFTPFL